jgi:peptidoglycan/LPS O-acetylase OafA/YrhL
MLRAVAYRTPEIGMHTHTERGETVKEDYMDGAQGIAIIAVVCATVLGRIDDAGFLQDGRVAHLLLLLQYTVCVFGYPCFFFLFGLRAADALRHANSRWAFAKMTVSALVYPYLLWSLLQMGVQWFIAQHANHPFPIEQLARVVWAPVDQFWFLYALCICQLIAYVTVRKTSRDTSGTAAGIAGTLTALLLVIVAALCATLATRTDWGIVTMTLWGLTFFLAGIVLGPRFSEWIARTARVPLLLAALVIFAVTVKVGQSLGGYLNASALPASFAGILATMLIARQLTGRWRVRWLTALGAAWMPVYLLHYLVTAAVWNALLAAFVTSPPAQFLLGAITGLVIPVGIYRLTKRLRIAAPAGFDLVDLAQRTEARQVELAHYRARIGIE